MDTLVGPIPCVGFFVACLIASIYFRESNYETPVIVLKSSVEVGNGGDNNTKNNSQRARK